MDINYLLTVLLYPDHSSLIQVFFQQHRKLILSILSKTNRYNDILKCLREFCLQFYYMFLNFLLTYHFIL